MKDYEIYKEEAAFKAWVCSVIDSSIESDQEEIQRYQKDLEDLPAEEREGHWKLDSIEAKKFRIKCGQETIKQILNGGKNK